MKSAKNLKPSLLVAESSQIRHGSVINSTATDRVSDMKKTEPMGLDFVGRSAKVMSKYQYNKQIAKKSITAHKSVTGGR